MLSEDFMWGWTKWLKCAQLINDFSRLPTGCFSIAEREKWLAYYDGGCQAETEHMLVEGSVGDKRATNGDR